MGEKARDSSRREGFSLSVAVFNEEGRSDRPSRLEHLALHHSKPPNLSRPQPGMQVEADTAVAIYAEGKEHAMAIGLTKMSTKEMREVGEVIGMEQGMG